MPHNGLGWLSPKKQNRSQDLSTVLNDLMLIPMTIAPINKVGNLFHKF